MMRRASIFMAVLGLGGLGLSGLTAVASAAPTVTARAAIVPIQVNPRIVGGKTYPGTGDILGAPAALEGEVKISRTEYGGFPSPLKQVKVSLPAGVKLNSKGFATCSQAILEKSGPSACPLKSFASSPGEANGVVSFGGERVHEKVSVQGFFVGGGLLFEVVGNSPVSLEKFATGFTTSSSSGSILTSQVPLIETVPEAPAASAEQIKITIGAAYTKGKKLISYGTVPNKCKGHFSGTLELEFYSGEHTTTTVTVPCPKHKK
jgi:hypothetical protein